MNLEKTGVDPRPFARSSLASFVWAAAIVVVVQTAMAEEVQSPRLRKYEDGLLTKADFQAKVPTPLPVFGGVRLKAVISTGIYYNYRYKASLDGERVKLTLSEIEVYGAVTPAKSWNASPGDAALMDHEQGHFDISAISAAQAQAKISVMIDKGHLQGQGKDTAAAKKDLDDRLAKVFKECIDQLFQADRYYDKETRHGADLAAQARRRRLHKRLLRELKITSKPKR